MSRDWTIYLDDILESCQRIQLYTHGLDRQAFEADLRTRDAVTRNLEIIGEAAKHIPDAVRQQIPMVDWKKVAGLRDILAHAYFGIDNDILWDIICHRVEPLSQAVAEFRRTDAP